MLSGVYWLANGQAKPQWAQGLTIVQRNVGAANDSGKTVEPVVGLSEWLGFILLDDELGTFDELIECDDLRTRCVAPEEFE